MLKPPTEHKRVSLVIMAGLLLVIWTTARAQPAAPAAPIELAQLLPATSTWTPTPGGPQVPIRSLRTPTPYSTYATPTDLATRTPSVTPSGTRPVRSPTSLAPAALKRGLPGKIAYTSLYGGHENIYIMTARDGKPALLTRSGKTDQQQPAISPDGKKIAYIARGKYYNGDVYVMNIDGSKPINLTDNETDENAPTWSPDGKKIAFETYRQGESQIFIMDADGSNPALVVHGGQSPAWSPDGKKLAYQILENHTPEILISHADGSEPVLFTTFGQDPAWSPDGRCIAYTSLAGQSVAWNTRVRVKCLDGAPDFAPRVKGNSREAAWSPDGKYLVYVSDGEDDNYELYVYSVESKTTARLTFHTSSFDWWPSWVY